ncbi:MAG: Asr1405/Asl0597 family protein [Pleurocapsa sp.]
MKSSSISHPILHIVSIQNTERWSIYRRLQELEIPCQCSTDRPLQVELNNPYEIAQLCYVFKQSTASRKEQINWLDNCWKIKSRQRKSKS